MGVYNTVKCCSQCARTGTKLEHQGQPELFPRAGLLKFVDINIFGLLPRTKTGSQHLIIITDKYIRLTRAVTIAKVTSTRILHIFFHDLVKLYSILDVIISDNGQKFVSNLFSSLCTYLTVN